jgi:anti-sigma B factor antagonist
MNAVERARWLAISPPLAIDSAPRSFKARKVTSLALIDLAFHVQGIALLKLHGEHDLSVSQRLAAALAAAEPQLDVLVDLSDCSFIDSSVIAALLLARARLVARGGRLELLIPPEATTIQRIATATALGALVPINETLSAALASFASAATN